MGKHPLDMNRIISIDVFRGLTILLMIFVNDVAGVREIPLWLKHAAPDSPGMTMVDVVFPAFLFIVGLAIPFAIARRESQYPERSVLLHIVIRTAGLLAIGLLMLNGPAVTSMNKAWWNVLMYTGAILFWSAPPRNEKYTKLHHMLKWLGLALLIYLLVIFRRNCGDTSSWIQTGWWGILGEIGFAYLIASLLWLSLRKKPDLMLLAPVLLLLLYIGDRSGQLDFLGKIKDIFYIGSHLGIHPLI
ncbi:MAG: DUF5009 domain-containing protein, partial [FCB group bacterium]|nr:DUF5009 domain-containing protein [FCB group bacterium]